MTCEAATRCTRPSLEALLCGVYISGVHPQLPRRLTSTDACPVCCDTGSAEAPQPLASGVRQGQPQWRGGGRVTAGARWPGRPVRATPTPSPARAFFRAREAAMRIVCSRPGRCSGARRKHHAWPRSIAALLESTRFLLPVCFCLAAASGEHPPLCQLLSPGRCMLARGQPKVLW